MLSIIMIGVLAICGPEADDPPSAVQISAWIDGLRGAEQVECAQHLSQAWPFSRGAVISNVEKHETPLVRNWCALILGDHQGKSEERALASAARSDGMPRVRAMALQQLAKHRGELLLETLQFLLEWEPDVANRITLLGLIERSERKVFVAPLIAAIATRFGTDEEKAAYAALRRITGSRLPNELGPWKAWLDAYESIQDQEREKEAEQEPEPEPEPEPEETVKEGRGTSG